MSGHADTALDQLRLADSCATTRDHEHLGFLAKAVVHALLDVAAAVREENAAVNAAISEMPTGDAFLEKFYTPGLIGPADHQ